MNAKISKPQSVPHPQIKMWQILGRSHTHIDFMSKRYYAFVISAILVSLGIIAALQIFVLGGANLGIEFTGGTSVEVSFAKPVAIDLARNTLSSGGFPNAQLQSAEGGKKLIVKVKKIEKEASGAVSRTPDRIKAILGKTYPGNTATLTGSQSIGPTVGSELRRQAIYASLYALLGILVYIGFRFDLKFGVAALIATFHDVLAVLGLIWLVNFLTPMEINMLIMTAILTIAGYSLTDTVVVFDRIRENLKKRKRTPLGQLLNDSINQVLSRTIITSLTSLLVVLVLLFLGGDVLRGFALAMTLGIIVGTYSSIFIASPVLLIWSGGRSKLLGQARALAGSERRSKPAARR